MHLNADVSSLTLERDALMAECNGGYSCYRVKKEGLPCTVDNCPVLKARMEVTP
jgi:hypothetical protein